jgi:hypothetical protein
VLPRSKQVANLVEHGLGDCSHSLMVQRAKPVAKRTFRFGGSTELSDLFVNATTLKNALVEAVWRAVLEKNVLTIPAIHLRKTLPRKLQSSSIA